MAKGRLHSFILLSMCLVFSPAYAMPNQSAPDGGDPQKLKKSLLEVQQKIQALEKTIYHSKSQERENIQTLAKLEKEIGEREETLRQLEMTMAVHDKQLFQIEQQYRQHSALNHIQQAALAQLLQSSFQHYHKEKLRLLLEPNEASSLARLNQYYQYFTQARSKKINELQMDLKKIQALQITLLKEQQIARELQQRLSGEKLAFAESKESRKRILTQLTKRMQGEEKQLTLLQLQETHLDKIFSTFHDKLPKTSSLNPAKHFASMKRLLALPITLPQAKLSALPLTASTRPKKSYIQAQEGTPVYAIYEGKVVFAEWLRGVGLLMIVDHGDGYMSLYGNNQKLYKSLGDKVEQGEMIARVGQSGGHAQAGLYFEIRKDGEALDPTPWFKQG